MTFSELRTEIMDRLNLSSPEASTRIGRAINRKYRLVTSSIGLQLSRRATVQQAVTIGVSVVIFTNTEKVINLVNKAVTPYRTLDQVSIEELREQHQPYSQNDAPTRYAIVAQTSDTISVEFNSIPQTAFILYADVHLAVADLSGSQEPAFPESFHDILIEGVMSDELRKMEKAALAGIANKEFDQILSDLRMWIAKSGYLDVYQGKTQKTTLGTGGGGGSSSGTNGASSYTQTGLITFDRDPSAPFAVSASSAVVANLDADKLDGIDSTAFVQKAVDATITGDLTFNNNPGAPFIVTAASAVVPNLDADKLDGFHETSFAKLADNETITGTWTFNIPPSGTNASSVLEGQVFS